LGAGEESTYWEVASKEMELGSFFFFFLAHEVIDCALLQSPKRCVTIYPKQQGQAIID
jgi:hypothetical protein